MVSRGDHCFFDLSFQHTGVSKTGLKGQARSRQKQFVGVKLAKVLFGDRPNKGRRNLTQNAASTYDRTVRHKGL
jgi:hypothetical protein